MNIDTALVYISLLLVIVSLLFSYLVWQKTNKRVRQLESQLEKQRAEIVRVNKVAIGVGRQVLNLQQESKSDENQELALAPASSKASTHSPAESNQNEYLPYSQAVDLLKQGDSLDDVQKKCRLSKAEAELLALMQSHEKSALPL